MKQVLGKSELKLLCKRNLLRQVLLDLPEGHISELLHLFESLEKVWEEADSVFVISGVSELFSCPIQEILLILLTLEPRIQDEYFANLCNKRSLQELWYCRIPCPLCYYLHHSSFTSSYIIRHVVVNTSSRPDVPNITENEWGPNGLDSTNIRKFLLNSFMCMPPFMSQSNYSSSISVSDECSATSYESMSKTQLGTRTRQALSQVKSLRAMRQQARESCIQDFTRERREVECNRRLQSQILQQRHKESFDHALLRTKPAAINLSMDADWATQ